MSPYIDDLDREEELQNARELRKFKNQGKIYIVISALITLLILSGSLIIIIEILDK